MLLAFVEAGVFDVIDSLCPMLLIGVVDHNLEPG
jgi:hypothetical protein